MYTVKNLLESGEFLQLHLISGDSGINREIKGVHIITLADAEKCLTGGEILFTNLKVYEKMSKEKFLFHLEELNKRELVDLLLNETKKHNLTCLICYWSIVKKIVFLF